MDRAQAEAAEYSPTFGNCTTDMAAKKPRTARFTVKAVQDPADDLCANRHSSMTQSTVFLSERAGLSESGESDCFDFDDDFEPRTPKRTSKAGAADFASPSTAASWPNSPTPSLEGEMVDIADLERMTRQLATGAWEAYQKQLSLRDELREEASSPRESRGLPTLLGDRQEKGVANELCAADPGLAAGTSMALKDLPVLLPSHAKQSTQREVLPAVKTGFSIEADVTVDGNKMRSQGSDPRAAKRFALPSASVLRQRNSFGRAAAEEEDRQACKHGARRSEASLSFASESTAFLSDPTTSVSETTESDGFDSTDDLTSKMISTASVADVASSESIAGIASEANPSKCSFAEEASDLVDLERVSRQLAVSALEAYKKRCSLRNSAREVTKVNDPSQGLPMLLGHRQRKDVTDGPLPMTRGQPPALPPRHGTGSTQRRAARRSLTMESAASASECAASASERSDGVNSKGSLESNVSSVAGAADFASGKTEAASEADIPTCSATAGAGDLADLERVSRQLAMRTREAYLKRLSSRSMADQQPNLRGPTLLTGRQRLGTHQTATTVAEVLPPVLPLSGAMQAARLQAREEEVPSDTRPGTLANASHQIPKILLAGLVLLLPLAVALAGR